MFTTIHPSELAASNAREKYYLVDIRSRNEFLRDEIAGAVHIPYHALPNNIDKLPTDLEVVLFCNDGMLAASARNFLKGFARMNNVSSLELGANLLQQKLQSKKAG